MLYPSTFPHASSSPFIPIFIITLSLLSSSFPIEFTPSTYFKAASWDVTRVVRPNELGRPDRSLREEMKKLEFSLQEGEDKLTQYFHIHSTHSLLYILCEAHCVTIH